MACNDVNQSAISEAKDQLFLDTADGARLDVVTGNLGLDRPLLTMGDDEWRAAAKSTALQAKLVEYAYIKMIEICVGPRYARIGTLAMPTTFGDKELTVLDGTPYVQTGTLVIDPGLMSEERVKYCIRDALTGVFELSTSLVNPHAIIPPAADRLRADALAGSTSLQLTSTAAFPTSGYPYPVMIDQGTDQEELVLVSNNNTGTNTLTVGATLNDHFGPISGPVVKPLAFDAPKGRTFIRLAVNATRVFPASGFIRIDHGNAGDEVVEFTENDVSTSVLTLLTPLAHAHVANVTVELVKPGAPVAITQVVELGIHWTITTPAAKHVQVTIPQNLNLLGPLDATWMHGASPAGFSTVLSDNAAPTDQWLLLSSVSGMQLEAGLVQIGLSQIAFYDLVLPQSDAGTTAGSSSPGAKSIPYNRTTAPDFTRAKSPFIVIVDPGGGNQETAIVIDAATDAGKLVFSPPLANSHSPGETIRVVNQVLLPRAVGNTYAAGSPVALFLTNYGGTDLEDGNFRGGPPYDLRFYHFAGGYIYDPDQRGISGTSSTLSTIIPPSTTVASSQLAGCTNLEVEDASLWPAPPFTPFDARIGAGAGFQEDQLIVNRTLRLDAAATATSNTAPGVTSLPYALTTVGEFPQSDGVAPAGYRVLLSRGTPRQEICYVNQNNTGTHTFTLVSPTTQSHNIGDLVELLADVLTMGPLSGPHAGPAFGPSADGELVQPLVTEIDMASLPAGFPSTGGFAWINFGKEIINQRKRIASITNATHYVLSSTANFPAANYPYQVILGQGTLSEERVFVTNNNTGINTLTFASPGALNTHTTSQYVTYLSGDPEVVEFVGTQASTAALLIDPPVTLEDGHKIGERVMFSPAVSQSNTNGSSYGFKLPPDPTACVTALLELVRAAGVRVDVIQR